MESRGVLSRLGGGVFLTSINPAFNRVGHLASPLCLHCDDGFHLSPHAEASLPRAPQEAARKAPTCSRKPL